MIRGRHLLAVFALVCTLLLPDVLCAVNSQNRPHISAVNNNPFTSPNLGGNDSSSDSDPSLSLSEGFFIMSSFFACTVYVFALTYFPFFIACWIFGCMGADLVCLKFGWGKNFLARANRFAQIILFVAWWIMIIRTCFQSEKIFSSITMTAIGAEILLLNMFIPINENDWFGIKRLKTWAYSASPIARSVAFYAAISFLTVICAAISLRTRLFSGEDLKSISGFFLASIVVLFSHRVQADLEYGREHQRKLANRIHISVWVLGLIAVLLFLSCPLLVLPFRISDPFGPGPLHDVANPTQNVTQVPFG